MQWIREKCTKEYYPQISRVVLIFGALDIDRETENADLKEKLVHYS